MDELPLASAGIANQLREEARVAGIVLYEQEADAVQGHGVARMAEGRCPDPPIHTEFYLMRAMRCGS
jgi:hypothetical protein